MDNKQDEVVLLVNHFKEWFDEKTNTLAGAANSNAETISFTENGGNEFAKISGRDKNMFLLGMRQAVLSLGDFPISMTDTGGHSLIATNDSNRLEFLIENRLRVEKWNTSPETVIYIVRDDSDDLVTQDFTAREAIDLAIKKYQEPAHE